jgi:hypothetical protein
MVEIVRWKRERIGRSEKMNYTAASMAGSEESRWHNPIGRFRRPIDMRSVPHERETRCELTEVENGDGVASKTAWSSGWRTARAVARGDRTLRLHSSFKRMRWLRLSSACDLYSPKALQTRKEEDLEADSVGRSKERNQPTSLGERRKP